MYVHMSVHMLVHSYIYTYIYASHTYMCGGNYRDENKKWVSHQKEANRKARTKGVKRLGNVHQ